MLYNILGILFYETFTTFDNFLYKRYMKKISIRNN